MIAHLDSASWCWTTTAVHVGYYVWHIAWHAGQFTASHRMHRFWPRPWPGIPACPAGTLPTPTVTL